MLSCGCGGKDALQIPSARSSLRAKTEDLPTLSLLAQLHSHAKAFTSNPLSTGRRSLYLHAKPCRPSAPAPRSESHQAPSANPLRRRSPPLLLLLLLLPLLLLLVAARPQQQQPLQLPQSTEIKDMLSMSNLPTSPKMTRRRRPLRVGTGGKEGAAVHG